MSEQYHRCQNQFRLCPSLSPSCPPVVMYCSQSPPRPGPGLHCTGNMWVAQNNVKLKLYCRFRNQGSLCSTAVMHGHGPFDILGGGGGLGFMSGPEIFFGQYRSKVIFFAGPSGRIIFFITESYKYRGFRDNFMLNSGFRDNYMLNSGFHNKFRLNSGFCHKFKLNLGFRDNCTLQEEQPNSFIVN